MEEMKQDSVVVEEKGNISEEANTQNQSLSGLPPNVAEFARRPLKEQKRLYNLSLYLMQAGLLHYILGALYFCLYGWGFISGFMGRDAACDMSLKSFSIIYYFLKPIVLPLLLLFGFGYLLRNYRSIYANIIIKTYSILAFSGGIWAITRIEKYYPSTPEASNALLYIFIIIALAVCVFIFIATLCKSLFSKDALSHKQISYIYRCNKKGLPIDMANLPKGL